jgi:hypothetical protein
MDAQSIRDFESTNLNRPLLDDTARLVAATSGDTTSCALEDEETSERHLSVRYPASLLIGFRSVSTHFAEQGIHCDY